MVRDSTSEDIAAEIIDSFSSDGGSLTLRYYGLSRGVVDGVRELVGNDSREEYLVYVKPMGRDKYAIEVTQGVVVF